jgi:hypothetical protein
MVLFYFTLFSIKKKYGCNGGSAYIVLNMFISDIVFFYDLQKEPTGREMVDPTTCLLTSSVTIGQHPALLDVDCPHDVTYKKNSITFDNPRISLNLKWEDMKFQQVLKYFNLYT